MNVTLSVLIPTYDRPDKILCRVRELIPQLDQDIELIVVDNASEVIVSAYLEENLGILPYNVTVYRNKVNIGAGPNICRCFEYASGKWSWILGDDDCVCPKAIQTIKNQIQHEQEEKIGLMCFSSEIRKYEVNHTVDNIKDLWKKLEYATDFSNFLFISTKVVKTQLFLEQLRIAYHFCYSCGPHVAAFISIIAKNVPVVFLRDSIVQWKAPAANATWSSYQVSAGITSLVEVIGAEKDGFHHIYQGLAMCLWHPFLRAGLYLLLIDESRPTEYWYFQFTKLSCFVKGKKWWYVRCLSMFALVMVKFPGTKILFRRLVGKLCVAVRSPVEGLSRN